MNLQHRLFYFKCVYEASNKSHIASYRRYYAQKFIRIKLGWYPAYRPMGIVCQGTML